MKFYQRRAVALVVLILTILGSSAYGISRKPAPLPEVQQYQWISDEAGLLSQETRSVIESYNEAWNEKYYAVVAVAAVEDISGRSPEEFAKELGKAWGLGDHDMLLLLAKGEDYYVSLGNGLTMTDTQQTKLKTAIEPDYYGGDWDAAVVSFMRQADVIYAQILGR